MSQYSTEPEYSVVESQETHHMESGQQEEPADYSQVVVDILELSQRVTKLVSMCLEINTGIRKLAVSLQVRE